LFGTQKSDAIFSFLKDYYLAFPKEDGAGPPYKDFLPEELFVYGKGMRKKNYEYGMFLLHFVAPVVGVKNWKHHWVRTSLSEYFTTTDEAFLLLCIESYRAKWIQECEQELSKAQGEEEVCQTPEVVSTPRQSN
jgi:hypothetical protein